jgi:hypothetical protein
MSQRVVNRVFDSTSAAASVITADIQTEGVDGLIIVAIATGAAAPTGMSINMFDPVGSSGPGTGIPAASAVTMSTLTAPSAGGTSIYWFGTGVAPLATLLAAGVYLGRATRITGTGGAASTLRYVIYTVKFQ